MGEAIWQGALTGLVLATFVGPIFFAVVDLGLQGHIRGAAWLAFGTFVSDILTVLFIYLVARSIDRDSMLLQVMYVAGGSVLLLMGLQNLLKKKQAEDHPDLSRQSARSLFARGFLINSTNPNVFFFWFGAVMSAVSHYQGRSALVLLHFFVALLIVFSTDFLKGYSASLLRPYIRPAILLSLSRISGIILIGFGIKLIFFH
ncbi:MAG: LysE family transporter [Bacteroidetes bacterium]|nr:LysE family transporter [Bacteroidota bacterium]